MTTNDALQKIYFSSSTVSIDTEWALAWEHILDQLGVIYNDDTDSFVDSSTGHPA
jgi:hypothetical protein